MNTADQLKAIISDLVNDGLEILKNSDSVNATDSGSMSELARKYIVWYTKARRLLGNTSPSDLKHFDELYRLEDEKILPQFLISLVTPKINTGIIRLNNLIIARMRVILDISKITFLLK